MPFLDWLFERPQGENTYHAAYREREQERIRGVYAALAGPHGDNATLYESTRNLVEAAHFPDATAFGKSVVARLIERCDQLRQPYPHFEIGIQMIGAAAGLYAAERLDDLPANPALYGSGADSVPLGFLRDLLLRQQRKAANPQATLDALTESLVASFLAICRLLPLLARGNPEGDLRNDEAASIPLVELLPDAGAVIEACLEPFSFPRAKELGLFEWFHGHLKQNAAKAAEHMRAKAPIPPNRYEGSAADIVDAYLADTPLERIFSARVPFTISIGKRLEHTAIVAGSGWGKTQLLQGIIAEDLLHDDPPSIIVVDSTNRMVERIQQLELFAGRLQDRLLIIDPERSPAPALNMFDLNTPRMSAYSADMRERVESDIIALFNYVFSSIQNPLTDPMRTVFSYMVRLLIAIPDANITTLRKLLEDNPKAGYQASAFKDYIERLDPTARDFFRLQFFTERVLPTRNSILQRLSSVISVPAFERMFSTVNKVDFFEETQRGTCILVNTSEAMLKDASPLFGRYIIARVMAAAFERAALPDEQRKPTFVIVDEAAPYFDDQFEKLLTRVRQFKLGIVIAFQHLEQASEKLRSAIASNTSVKYAGGLGYADSRWLAREMRTTPEQLLALRKDSAEPPQYTNYACYVRGMDSAVNLTMPFYTLEGMPKMSAAQYAELLARNSARTAYQPPPPKQPHQAENPSPPQTPAVEPVIPTEAPAPIPSSDPGEPAANW